MTAAAATKALKHAPGLSIVEAPLLAERTTMRLGGHALAEARIENDKGLEALPEFLARMGGKPAILGKGSNLLVADGHLPLVLISLHGSRETWFAGESEDTVLLGADAELPLPGLLSRAASLGLSGLENLCGIPGTVGGALAMNAGSFGADMGTAVRQITAFLPGRGLTILNHEQVDMQYRSFAVKGHENWYLITGAVFALQKAPEERIREAMAGFYAQKRSTQPVTARSAGCVFKNPHPGHPAGKLLQEAGLRGFKLGGMAFSQIHANFLVNEGNGTFAQAMELIALARDKVRERSGFSLELEVCVWP